MTKLEDLKDLNALRPPLRGATAFTSRVVRGLMLLVKSNGRKEWHYRHQRPGGKRTTLKLGDWPLMTLEAATLEAAAAKQAVRRGVDVVYERRQGQAAAARQAANRASLVEPRWRADTLLAEYVAAQEGVLRPSTLKRIRSVGRVYVLGTAMAGWDIRAWPTVDYDALLLDLAKSKVAVASGVHRTMRAAFGWAVDSGRLPFNPLAGRRSLTRKLKVQPRTEVLSGPQLHRLLSEGERTYNDLWPVLWLQLHTGLRVGEVCALRWAQIDMRGRLARLPASVMKGKVAAEVVLSDAVRRMLVQLRKSRPNSAAVFDWSADDVIELLRRARGPLTRTHTLRRTVATTLQQLGVGEEVRRAILNHAAAQGIGKHYDHAKLRAAQLAALERLAAHWAKVAADPAAHSTDDITADDALAAEFDALT